MRRELALLVTVAVSVTALLAALLNGAVRSVEREEAMRQAQIADRIVDGLERELSKRVEREEARPFLHYRYAWIPSNEYGNAGAGRSPLAELPSDPAIIGYFQIDPDGALGTPHRPADGPTINPIQDVRAVEARLEEATEHLIGPPDAAVASNTRPVVPAPPPKPAPSSSLPSPNKLSKRLKGGSNRVESVLPVQASNWVADNALTPQRVAVPQPQQAAPDLPLVQQSRPPSRPRQREADAELDVLVTPFRLVPGATDDTLLLVRTVELGRRSWTQGLAFDRDALFAQLDESVLDPTIDPMLAEHVRLVWRTGATPPSQDALSHVFPPPFSALAVDVLLGDLPAQRSTAMFWGLSALIVLVVTLAAALGSYWVLESRRLARQRADFVAAVSHELRSPLTSIRMYSEMLEQGMIADPERQRGYFTTIREETQRLSRLVEDVLAFSRLDRGAEAELRGPPGTVDDALEEIRKLYSPIVAAQQVTWVESIAERARRLPVADRDALVQILTNLIDNAIKFSKDAAVQRVEVAAEDTGDSVVLAVRDAGPGVDDAFLDDMFDAFTRGEAELTRSTQGTGIGLALVRQLATALGGRTRARNLRPGFEVAIELPWPTTER
jgi:signal transduction histidine kinase